MQHGKLVSNIYTNSSMLLLHLKSHFRPASTGHETPCIPLRSYSHMIFPILPPSKYTECHLQGKIPNIEIQKILRLCEYVGDVLITTQFLFAAPIHSKGVKFTP